MPQILPKFHRIAFAAPALALAMSAMAAPPPLDAMDAAHRAVTMATNPVGDRYAPQELSNAHQRLDAAEAAMTKRDYKQARALADEARADADLARAKSQALSARAQIDQRTQDNADLQHRLLDQQPLGVGGMTPLPMNPPPDHPLMPPPPPTFTPQPDDGFQPMPPTGNAASTNAMGGPGAATGPAPEPSGGFTPVEPTPMAPDRMTHDPIPTDQTSAKAGSDPSAQGGPDPDQPDPDANDPAAGNQPEPVR